MIRRFKFFTGLSLFCLPFVNMLLGQAPTNKSINQLVNDAYQIYAQKPALAITLVQSAYHLSQNTQNGPQQFRCLNILTTFFLQAGKYENADDAAKAGLYKAIKDHNDSMTGDFWVFRGAISRAKYNYNTAINYYLKGEKYYHSPRPDLRLANLYYDLGICEKKISKFQLANTFYFKAASIYQLLHDSVNLSDTYNAIGSCFAAANDYSAALSYYKRSFLLREPTGDKERIALSFNNIGYTFKQMGRADSAIHYLAMCLKIEEVSPDSSAKILTLQNLGLAWKLKGNNDKAKSFIERSISIAQKLGMQEELVRGEMNLTEMLLANNDWRAAKIKLYQIRALLFRLRVPELQMDFYNKLSAAFLAQGDYKATLQFKLKYDTIKDSLFTITKNNAINELELKYRTKEHEDRMRAMTKQNNLQSAIVKQQSRSIWILVLGALLLICSLIIAYHHFKLKNAANGQIKLLMKELHHRTSNNLQLIDSLIELQLIEMDDSSSKEVLVSTQSRLLSMSIMHRELYSDQADLKVEVKEYLTNLTNNLMKSFGEKYKNVSLRVHAEPLIMTANMAIPFGLIVNELITNAYKHAFDGKPGEIFLSLTKISATKIKLSINDNGKGVSAPENSKSSFGLRLISLLTRQLRTELVVTVDHGTACTMIVDI